MPVETPSQFAQAIQEHLELKQRNSTLERQMPLNTYKSDDPFENHPLFKTEEQARLEDTMEEPAVATNAELEDSLWGRESRDFDWGD